MGLVSLGLTLIVLGIPVLLLLVGPFGEAMIVGGAVALVARLVKSAEADESDWAKPESATDEPRRASDRRRTAKKRSRATAATRSTRGGVA